MMTASGASAMTVTATGAAASRGRLRRRFRRPSAVRPAAASKHLVIVPMDAPAEPIGLFPSWGLGNYPTEFLTPRDGAFPTPFGYGQVVRAINGRRVRDLRSKTLIWPLPTSSSPTSRP